MGIVFENLSALSESLVSLAAETVTGVVAVKSAPYRVVSGVALADDLIGVTDYSLRRSDRVPIQAFGGAEGTASIVGRIPGVDLALLKVEGIRLKPLPIFESLSAKAGMTVIVVGLTIDAGPSVSMGILGAVGGPRRSWRGGAGTSLDQFLRLDVNIYPSQSGAAVVDAEGRLIGMATPSLLRHSAVAVPSVTLQRLAQELLTRGRIRHGYLGVGLQPVAIPPALRQKADVRASGFAAFSELGLIVLSIEPGSPAEQASLQLGDILVALDQRSLGDIDDLQAVLGENVDRSVSALILRGGEAIQVSITIAERGKKES